MRLRRRRSLGAVAALVAISTAACTGSPPHLDPPNLPSTVVSSIDRIRQGQTRLGGSVACIEDEFCAAGLTRVYGIQLGSGGVALDSPASVLEALSAGAIDVGELPASAIPIGPAAAEVTVLADDRQLVPAQNVVAVLGPASKTAGGTTLTAALDAVSAAFDQASLVGIEQAVTAGSAPELAAEQWLQSHDLTIAGPPPGARPVVIGFRSDAESQALSDVYAAALAHGGWSTSLSPVGLGRPDEIDALQLGHVAVVPDATSTLLEQLDGFAGLATADLQYDMVVLRELLARLGLAATSPAPASPSVLFVVSRAVATNLSLSSLSDLARASVAHVPPLALPVPLTPSELTTDTDGRVPARPSTLGIGSRGPTVIALQRRLQALGYTVGSPTGLFTETTRKAVAAFQASVGLIGTAATDPATNAALAAAIPGGHPAPAPTPGDEDTVAPPAFPGTAPAGAVYLVFGDGPSDVTPQILDVLRKNKAAATFFADNAAALAYPQTLRAILAAGDEIGISTPPHNAASPMAADALGRTLSASDVAIASVDGHTPTCQLAPYGATDPASRTQASAIGLSTVLWNIDPQDWRHPGANVIVNDVLGNVGPGSIVLLHDGGGDRAQTVVALETIVPTLVTLGYSVSALPGC